jgi:hypothetical protein
VKEIAERNLWALSAPLLNPRDSQGAHEAKSGDEYQNIYLPSVLRAALCP